MKLSIIVPIYNVEPYLRRCIDSILVQTFTDYEMILVDDGSPDNCGAICDEYASRDPRISVIHKKNGGLADARNAGIEVARGEYFGFIDSDDSIHPDMFRRMLELAQEHHAQMVSCGILMLDQGGTVFGHWPELEHDRVYGRDAFINDLYPHVRTDLTPSVCNKLFHRDVFRTIRFPVGRYYEDSFIQYYYARQDSIMNSRYSLRCMDLIDFSLENYRFYQALGIREQQGHTLAVYADSYLKNLFPVYLTHRELIKDLRPHKERFNKLLIQILQEPKICKLKKLTILTSYISKKAAYHLCKKYFPECIMK